jgi:hypothetical protein
MMTMDEIKDAADMAEKWPGATVLNWSELNTQAFCDWVAQVKQSDIGAIALIGTFDLESAKGFFEDWWRSATVAAGRNNGRVPTGSRSVTAGETAHIHSANKEVRVSE